jgi:hypothetical protein
VATSLFPPMSRLCQVPARLLLVLGLLLLVAGCSDDSEPPKKDTAAASDDSGLGSDTAVLEELPGDTDAEEATDAEAPTDAEEEPDLQTDITLLETKDGCTPDCKGKICGPDGCGKVCGFCPSGQFCAPDGKTCAAFCQKKCDGKSCGDDGCGGKCGVCEDGFYCGVDSKCYENACVGSCQGKNCGDDGCGKSCGLCAAGDYCDATGNCKASACKGLDPKGLCEGDIYISCEGDGAAAKKVIKDCAAPPNLNNLTCDWDPAKSLFGCVKNQCKNSCILEDGKKQICGPNPCGISCGVCTDGWKCDVTICTPQAGAPCGTFPAAGKCSGDVLTFCNTGKLSTIDCLSVGAKCGWNGSLNKFECKYD